MLLLLLACAAHSPEPASSTSAAPRFRYDAATGRCVDDAGKEGRNPVDIEVVRATRDAECADLRGVQLLPPSTGDLQDWKLQGADLSDASLHFSNIVDADLRGADLSSFKYGYVHITGIVDGFTRLATDCKAENSRIDCMR